MPPVRIQLSRRRGWRMPPNTVKCTRPGKWGNEFRLGDHVQHYGGNPVVQAYMLDTIAKVVACHRERMELALAQHPELMRPALDELRGKNLACWCHLCAAHEAGKPLGVQCDQCEPCHVDNLLELANR